MKIKELKCSNCGVSPRAKTGSRCVKCRNEYQLAYFAKYPERRKKSDYEYKRKIRKIVLDHYSNGDPKCKCCGEREIDFLCLDHIDNDGYKERKAWGGGVRFHRNLIKSNFSSNLQVLCHNCNFGKMKYGGCPHQRKADT